VAVRQSLLRGLLSCTTGQGVVTAMTEMIAYEAFLVAYRRILFDEW
jgi:hypothetical protein